MKGVQAARFSYQLKAAPSVAERGRIMSDQKLRVGLIGSGGIGRHYINMFKKAGTASIVAASDVSESALAEVEKMDTSIVRFTDYKKMLKTQALDAVAVCTPNKLHLHPTVDALKAGLPVIVEKPMAMNAGDAQKMCDAAKKSGKLLMIGFQWRFHPMAQLVRRSVDDGSMGKILYVRCQALRRRGIPSWGVFGRKDIQGGGPMIDIGVHILEMAHYMMGKPKPVSANGSCYTYLGNRKPAAVAPWGDWDHKTYTVEDLAIGMLRFENGATLVIESSFAAHIEKDVWNVTVMGEKGGAQFDPPTLFRDEAGHMMNVTPTHLGETDGFIKKVRHFVDCVKTGCACEAPGEDGVAVQQMLDAIYKSSDTGKVATI
jgi:predicted dehydrogenase